MQLLKSESLLIIDRANRTDHGWLEAVDSLLKTVYPELGIQIEVQASDKAAGLEALRNSWQEAVHACSPDWLILPLLSEDFLPCSSSAQQAEDASLLETAYLKAAIRSVIAEAKARVRQLILFMPALPGAESFELESDQRSASLCAAAVRDAAYESGCLVIEEEAVIDEVRSKYVPFGMQPNDEEAERSTYNIALAGAFLRLVGFQWLRRRSIAPLQRAD